MRVRRSYSETDVDESFEDPSGERVEGLELELSRMKRKMARMYKLMTRMSAKQKLSYDLHKFKLDLKNDKKSVNPDLVNDKKSICIDYQGFFREENEKWTHVESKKGVSCAECICKSHQIHCQKVNC